MYMNYSKLWKLLIDKNLGKGQLRKLAELSPNTLTKMRKEQMVSMSSLCRICDTLQVNLSDIVEYTPEPKEEWRVEYMTISEAAEKWHITPRRVQVYCNKGRIPGAHRFGHAWAIPADAEKPSDKRIKSGKYKKRN